MTRCSPHGRTSKLIPPNKRALSQRSHLLRTKNNRRTSWKIRSLERLIRLFLLLLRRLNLLFVSDGSKGAHRAVSKKKKRKGSLFKPRVAERGRREGGGRRKIGKGCAFYRNRISDAGNAQCWIWQPGAGNGFFLPYLLHPPNSLFYQTMLSTVLGFSAFGFAARIGQLAIQKRPLFSSESPPAHDSTFNYLGN